MTFVYSLTLGWSAFLLFLIQPILGKMLLPHFGGTPSVWNLCMFFFQAMLLGGYFYAHQFAQFRQQKIAKIIHWCFFTFAAIYCYIGQEKINLSSDLTHPSLQLLSALALFIGLPFLMLSTTASLLQNWYAHTLPNKDPYALYVSSNIGSLSALIIYPIAIEPLLSIPEQLQNWRFGFVFLLLLIGICAWNSQNRFIASKDENNSPAITWKIKTNWLILAFLPSSLLIGTTTYISADIASLPLLWVIPLILYLFSFILAFSPFWQNKQWLQPYRIGRISAFFASICLLGIILESNQPGWIFFPAHLILFFLLSLLCHMQLALNRPNHQRLTHFYLFISIGGVLGGLLNSLIAPQFFPGIIEYPLIFLWATAMRPGRDFDENKKWQSDFTYAFMIAFLLLLLVFAAKKLSLSPGRFNNLFVLGIPMILVYRQVTKPRKFALAAIFVFLSTHFAFSGRGHHLLYSERNFFGINKVVTDKGNYQLFFHGSTLHGQQSFAPEMRQEPLAYFSRLGPMGDIFTFVKKEKLKKIGIVGLGIGTLAAYAEPGESWTFFELDPAVLHIARDSQYFTYLKDSKASEQKFIIGDARLKLSEIPDQSFDLLVLDAFTSDAIPTHLITKEAIELYWRKLSPQGVLVFNISNRYFNFAPVLANLADATGAKAEIRELEVEDGSKLDLAGAAASSWVVMHKKQNALIDKNWVVLKANSNRLWTDSYSNLISLF